VLADLIDLESPLFVSVAALHLLLPEHSCLLLGEGMEGLSFLRRLRKRGWRRAATKQTRMGNTPQARAAAGSMTTPAARAAVCCFAGRLRRCRRSGDDLAAFVYG